MNIKEKLVEITDHQIRFNKDKNIYFEDNKPVIRFSPLTKKVLEEISGEILKIEEEKNFDEIINFSVEQVLKALWHSNQYISISESEIDSLKKIYFNFWHDLLLVLKNKKSFEELEDLHTYRLKMWLETSNPFVKEINPSTREKIRPVVNAEYTPSMQMEILDLEEGVIKEPFLDIGCGKDAFLINYLRSKGIDAYGMEREVPRATKHLIKADWLNFNYKPAFWGTIVSHMGFSNHFIHHHYRKDGNYPKYGQVYMNILNSLKKGGRFHYAPGLPMIEIHLPGKQYKIHTRMIHAKYANCVIYKNY